MFGDLPISEQCLNKPFGDGTELSLYRTGWVTLSGLACVGSSPTIEHEQEVIDQLNEELWSHLATRKAALAQEPASASGYSAYLGDPFVLGLGRSAGEDLIRQFIQGWNRTPKQLGDIVATWDLGRGWDHGSTPDNSFYTKRIVEEALWLQRKFGWTLQEVVDMVITFCKKHLFWSLRCAKKADRGWPALHFDSNTSTGGRGCWRFRIVDCPQHPPHR